MTEDEARKKWCPMVRKRFGGTDEPACNMREANCSEKEAQRPKCIASDCMMWQFSNHEQYTDDGDLVPTGDCGLKR